MTLREKLAAVHAAIKQPVKDSVNPHFGKSYASLNECNKVVMDAIREVGDCDYWHRAVFNEAANCWEMQVVFSADGQETVLSSHPFRDDPNPQKAASASTYARRYSLSSAFNLAAEDDDGNQASKPTPRPEDPLKVAKNRLWAAMGAYAAKTGKKPEDVLEGVKKRPEWGSLSSNADWLNSVATEYEGLCDE